MYVQGILCTWRFSRKGQASDTHCGAATQGGKFLSDVFVLMLEYLGSYVPKANT